MIAANVGSHPALTQIVHTTGITVTSAVRPIPITRMNENTVFQTLKSFADWDNAPDCRFVTVAPLIVVLILVTFTGKIAISLIPCVTAPKINRNNRI